MLKTRTQRIGLAVTLILLLGVAEALIHRWREPEGYLMFVNEGTSTVRDLVVTFQGRDFSIPRIDPAGQAGLYVGAQGTGPLKVTYKLDSGEVGGLSLPEYEPAQLAADGQRITLILQGSQFTRYQEDTRPRLDQIWARIREALAPYW